MIISDFSTQSPQAKVAELLKLNVKVTIGMDLIDSHSSLHVGEDLTFHIDLSLQIGVDLIDSHSSLHGAYFHYHHDEVQYWASVISRILSGEQTLPKTVDDDPEMVEDLSHNTLKTSVSKYIMRRKMKSVIEFVEVSSALSSASCAGLLLGVQSFTLVATVNPELIDEDADYFDPNDVHVELDIQKVYCQHMESQVSHHQLNGHSHFWDHLLFIDTLMVKLRKLGEEANLDCMICNTQLEWSTNIVNTAMQFLGSLQRSRSSSGEIILPPAPRPRVVSRSQSWWQKWKSTLRVDMSNVNVFLTNNFQVGLMLRLDTFTVDHAIPQSAVILEGCKVVYVQVTGKSLGLLRSTELHHPVFHLQELRATFKQDVKEANVQILKDLSCDWRTCHHMCIIQALQDSSDFIARIRTDDIERPTGGSSAATPFSEGFKVNVVVLAHTSFTLHLSKDHSITIVAESYVMSYTKEELLMELKMLAVKCDDAEVFNISGILFGNTHDCELETERMMEDNLILKTNRAWNISFDSCTIVFPYAYNFAACFDEFVNVFKWIKLVHKVQRKPFTIDSKLPPDLKLKGKVFMIQLCDDPFEVKLGDNYDLMKDEETEGIKRRRVMDQKIASLRKMGTFLPEDKVKDLYDSLGKKSSDIYIQRSRQLYATSPMRTKLFTWKMEGLEILALADLSYHGKDNVLKCMKEIDKDSPLPDGLDFLTMWCRTVHLSMDTWTIMLRDYPQPMLEVKDMHLWGKLVGAEQDGTKRAKRFPLVEVAGPWGDMAVERNLPALKFYHDFSCDIHSWTMAYGPCWEPALAQYNLCLDLVNKPSVDPSRPMPWWDKSRILLHGRLTASIKQMSWLYHASLDPYNSTEMMDWSWSEVVLDWTNAKIVLKGDLDIYARTASKYDDCRLLHLPNLRLCLKLEWLCLGDANDHHAVMPCAPDKIPDYSMEEHDSFRAFRSQNLNLDISMDTKPLRDTTLNVPSCLFYASTIKFLDKLKLCLLAVTRPIRRGRIFKNTKPKKIQLTRHYKSIKLSVNLHRFNACYWMSFAKQHGSELLADAFVLHLCNDLTLTPVEDGLWHRPAADWSVRYLICDLTDTRSWLQSARTESDELNVSYRNPVDKSFFISVHRVSYKRGDFNDPNSDPEEERECRQDKMSATHNVHVYGMKGAWTKHNRNVLLGLYDSYQKAQSLKRNLSADALKGFKIDGGQQSSQKNRSMSMSAGGPPSPPPSVSPSPLSKLQTGHALAMLMKLVAESDSKSVVFTEEPSSTNLDELHGMAACQTDDVICRNWQIELHNAQMVLKGVETSGNVIVSAAKAQILSCTHTPVWKNSQLRSKTTWVGSVECMQYYATVDPSYEFEDDCYPWLSAENVEDRSEADLSGLPEMVASGHSVGGVVYSTVGSDKKSRQQVQLQRIISRCKCQLFYASYGEVDLNLVAEVPPPPSDDSDMMTWEEGVDAFTLLHHDLNVCTNHLQYNMILDIVNNLLLHVEQKKKDTSEKLQSMRFQLQLSSEEDQKTPIQQLQAELRQECERLRRHEKDLYLIHKALDDDEDNEILLQQSEELEEMLFECKEKINNLNEELAMRISCFKENQLQVKVKTTKAQQASVDRRNEVCFKFAQWRLTEADGQLGITDLALRNFVYTKENRDNDTWTHQLELGWVKVTNLLPNSLYKDVLVPRDPLGYDCDRQMALRIISSEKPPVGGIAVKEHFEVNVAPMQIQMTYQFYKTVMGFFFPDKNIETDDQDHADGNSMKKKEKKSSLKKESMKQVPSSHDLNEIDKMKERAANNNTFYYVKVPEVSLRVSYKGEKDKNIEDIHDFSIKLPTLEYHNCIWTWFDMLMSMKNDCKRVILSQAIKQKLHMRSRIVPEETPLTDVQQEEDKMKMLLGAKILVSFIGGKEIDVLKM
ncbi:hypothetical protein FSP39_019738 [Pinctada imbricata]|uniref:FMP27/BLTP2/Hobbit GFWDK motif-containing RBG unit domain-containing protein n=1 Tax=Pinctada imbricata TaxID=66713 RepID=A0AA88XP50_PINIB|nr:hypothetical protein FSP39_019738 [Pinctada imbricata]